MNDGQAGSQGLQHGHGRRLVVNENASLAVDCDVAAQNDLRPCAVDSVFLQHLGDGRIVALIHGGDRGLFRAVAHHVAVGLLAQQQRQGVDEDGLARAGLAGQQIQSSPKLNHHVVDDGVVFNAQFPEHSAPVRWSFPGEHTTPGLSSPYAKSSPKSARVPSPDLAGLAPAPSAVRSCTRRPAETPAGR